MRYSDQQFSSLGCPNRGVKESVKYISLEFGVEVRFMRYIWEELAQMFKAMSGTRENEETAPRPREAQEWITCCSWPSTMKSSTVSLSINTWIWQVEILELY